MVDLGSLFLGFLFGAVAGIAIVFFLMIAFFREALRGG